MVSWLRLCRICLVILLILLLSSLSVWMGTLMCLEDSRCLLLLSTMQMQASVHHCHSAYHFYHSPHPKISSLSENLQLRHLLPLLPSQIGPRQRQTLPLGNR